MKQRLLYWWLGLNKACLQGGAISVKAFLAPAAAHAVIPGIPAIDLKTTLLIFGGSVLYHFWDYCAANPLPIALPPATPSPTTPITAAASTEVPK